MVYRDRPLLCPACRRELDRDGTRSRWRCPSCGGAFTSTGELALALYEVAPELRPDGAGHRLVTPGRRPDVGARFCAVCNHRMTPVFLGGVNVERCYVDDHLWFDAGELVRVMDQAERQHADSGLFATILRALRW